MSSESDQLLSISRSFAYHSDFTSLSIACHELALKRKKNAKLNDGYWGVLMRKVVDIVKSGISLVEQNELEVKYAVIYRNTATAFSPLAATSIIQFEQMPLLRGESDTSGTHSTQSCMSEAESPEKSYKKRWHACWICSF
jgi:hypothetical protein